MKNSLQREYQHHGNLILNFSVWIWWVKLKLGEYHLPAVSPPIGGTCWAGWALTALCATTQSTSWLPRRDTARSPGRAVDMPLSYLQELWGFRQGFHVVSFATCGVPKSPTCSVCPLGSQTSTASQRLPRALVPFLCFVNWKQEEQLLAYVVPSVQ